MLAAGRGGGAQGRGACAKGVEVVREASDACGKRRLGAAPAVNAPQVAVPRGGARRTAAIDARLRRLAGVRRVRDESQTNLNVGRVATWVGSLAWVGSLPTRNAVSCALSASSGVRTPSVSGVAGAYAAAVRALREFRRAYAEARARWRAGFRDVVFPAGTWWMARGHSAVVASPP